MISRQRAIWMVVFLACGFTVISFNLVQIQLVAHDKFWRLAVEKHLHPEKIAPQRGAVYDADGNVLAQTRQVCNIRLDGKLITNPAADLPRIEQILGLPDKSVSSTFSADKRYRLIAEDVEDVVVTKLQALKLKGLIYEAHNVRAYPNAPMAAHIVGYLDSDGQGAAGVEKEMDRSLTGVPGLRWVERDALRREIAGYQCRELPATNGYNVTLTVKLSIQHVIEEQLDQIVQTYSPNGAYIIVMNPHTGEILAMGSRPSFDPNDRKTFDNESVRNRCITDMVEPGSVFKTITLAGALNEGKVRLDTPIFCENGTWFYGGRELKDDEHEAYGSIPAIEAFAHSSNIGLAKIAVNYLGEDRLYKYATAFGIGTRTNLFDGQGESTGLLRPVNKWSALSITRIPMGQEVAATPIQMATAMSVIANGGRLVMPQLVKEVKDSSGRRVKVFPPKIVRQVITPDAARDVTRALEQVTIDGTASKIKIDGFTFAGKTGTAQKFVDGAYSHTKFVASFIGFMPAEDPAFVTLVMVDEPKTKNYYGSQVAAPVFANIGKQVAQILNLVPDQPVPTPTALSANAEARRL